MSNLAGSIAGDRESGLYSKLSSMPVSPWTESLGRIITVIVFSSIGSSIIIIVGLITGAEFVIGSIDLMLSIGIVLLIVFASSGIGLIISCFVGSESAASHVGVAIVLLNFFIGVALPYGDLPELLQPFARINPISSGNSMITTLLIGQDVVGYNPWSLVDIGLLICIPVLALIIGLYLYSRYSWSR